MKYLIKQQVKLNHHEGSEDETRKPSTEEKSWGVEEEDDVRLYFILHLIFFNIVGVMHESIPRIPIPHPPGRTPGILTYISAIFGK